MTHLSRKFTRNGCKDDEHVSHYSKRWSIEMLFRTTKQSIGLQECQSRSLVIQQNHVAAVLLAYAIAQLEMKKYKLDTPESAIRASEARKRYIKKDIFACLNQDYFIADA
ncbi:transposase [Candidatus Dependentiae bacterium]|nr:transposase [Candidatus Dependentiae bacterium]